MYFKEFYMILFYIKMSNRFTKYEQEFYKSNEIKKIAEGNGREKQKESAAG